ncbi:unnamed protein product, partial [marine sediment metagenome]
DTGAAGKKEIIIDQVLNRGYYFLAIRCTAAPTLRGLDDTFPLFFPVSGQTLTPSEPLVDAIIPVAIAAYADPAPAPTDLFKVAYCFVSLREA